LLRTALPAFLLAVVALAPILAARPASAAFLGKRAVVAVSAPQPGHPRRHDIYLMGQGGRKVQNLTLGRLSNALDPTFSPEGGPHIAFVNRPVNGGPGNIVVIDRDSPGSGPSQFVVLPMNTSANEDSPAWSPSGGKIAFARTVNGKQQIWTTNLRGDPSKTKPLTCCTGPSPDHRILGSEPAWSPDSSQIAYAATTPNGTFIKLAAVDMRKPEITLTRGDEPNWSPLGDHLTFVRGGNLFVAPLNERHTGLAASPRMLDDRSNKPAKDHNPAFSPDFGGIITFDRGNGVVYKVDPRATPIRVRRLSDTSFPHVSHADWQPDCNVKAPPTGHNVLDESNKAGPLLICGKKGEDIITGTSRGDRIFGGEGDDVIRAGAGDDFVLGGQGGDSNSIYGGPGSDHLEGGTGPDHITDTSPGRDVIKGQDGNDRIVANDGIKGNDNVDGGLGFDRCTVDSPNNQFPPNNDFVIGCEDDIVKWAAELLGLWIGT
jgi:hypothetical protein